MIVIILGGILTLYLGWLIRMIVAWYMLIRSGAPALPVDVRLKYSIIIPARNEGKNISTLLDSILANDFPLSNYEIIIIDDHSDDDTLEKIDKYRTQVRYQKLEGRNGKKAALAKGIEMAKGDVIITTDADCVVSPNWLLAVASYFETQKAFFLSGGVVIQPSNNVFQRLQTIEFASLIGVGASTIYMKKPGMCNGANLAFTRDVFYEVKGYADNLHLASGDDEFLMHKIAAKYPDRIFFNTLSESFVFTQPLRSISDFIEQRKRWASKWKYYRSWRQSAAAVFIGITNIAIIWSLIAITQGTWYLLVPLLLKLVLETLYLKSILKFMSVTVGLFYFILIQIIYPFYVVYFVLVANLAGYKWKGRSYK